MEPATFTFWLIIVLILDLLILFGVCYLIRRQSREAFDQYKIDNTTVLESDEHFIHITPKK